MCQQRVEDRSAPEKQQKSWRILQHRLVLRLCLSHASSSSSVCGSNVWQRSAPAAGLRARAGATRAAAQRHQRRFAARGQHATCWIRNQVRGSSSAAAHAARFEQQQPRAARTFDLPRKHRRSLTRLCLAEAGGFLTFFFLTSRISH